jgi:soluble lytic murein transglycosylase-like protein
MLQYVRKIAAGLFLCISVAVAGLAASPAAAAGWENVRETSMRLKEAGRGAQAYSTAASFVGPRASDMFDREFVCGWIALRNLNRADIALNHFLSMTKYISGIDADKQGFARAKAGYWLGRALKAQNRTKDAAALYSSSMAFSTTFYGQLSASELNQQIDKSKLPRTVTSNFPIKDLYWHDQRARKELVLAVIREESRFKQNSTSPKKARGMMQVMDATALAVGKKEGVSVDVGMMRNNADYNIIVGTRYLGGLLDQYGGNPMLAVAAYNAGPLRVDEWLRRFGDPRGGRVDPVDFAENIPFRETREYVQKVMGSYITYLALHQSPTQK